MFQSTRPRGARPTLVAAVLASFSVSIHAPAWGATNWRWRSWQSVQSFNPRARVGRDKFDDLIYPVVPSFNPRARVGRDYPSMPKLIGRVKFQSTRPRGARQALNQSYSRSHRFQSTRPRGARPYHP